MSDLSPPRRLYAFTRWTIRAHREGHAVGPIVRRLPRWWRSLSSGRSPLEEQIPWIGFEAIDYLRGYLRAHMNVFEYGTGGSTLFFARRVARVHSIEHDRSWYVRVREALSEHGASNVTLQCVEATPTLTTDSPDAADPNHFASDAPPYRGMSFERYVRAIEEHPDGSLDVVLIDGRSRPACCVHAQPKVRTSGLVVVDNSERDYYGAALSTFDPAHWERTDMFGPLPSVAHFSRTTFFRKL